MRIMAKFFSPDILVFSVEIHGPEISPNDVQEWVNGSPPMRVKEWILEHIREGAEYGLDFHLYLESESRTSPICIWRADGGVLELPAWVIEELFLKK
jgi:hypothetical protein